MALADSAKIVDKIEWTISQNYLMKNDIMIIDLLANNNWKRPVYFATTVGSENFLNLDDYFQLEGLAYRLVPIKLEKRDEKDKRVYLDENNLRMTTNMRINTIRLTDALINAGKNDSAMAVLDKCMEEMPDYNVPYDIFMTRVAEQYLRLFGNLSDSAGISNSDFELEKRKGCQEKGVMIVKRLAQINEDNMDYYLSLKGTDYYKSVESDVNQSLYVLQSLPTMVRTAGLKELSDSLAKNFQHIYQQSGM